MRKDMRSIRLASMAAAGLLVSTVFLSQSGVAHAQRAATGPSDWPCVQRLVPELSWSAIWSGPSIEELERNWWEDEEVGRTVRFAASRDTPSQEALERVNTFLESNAAADEERLSLLFAGLFDRISRERSRTIEAIRSYTHGQVDRLETIGALVDELEEARSAAENDPQRVERLENEIFWERRVFEDRQSSLRALCEQPYLLEERLSRMVRAIQAKL